MMTSQPRTIIHADWGTDPKKRWHCVARRSASGYRLEAPELAGNSCTYVARMLDRYGERSLLLGFDFPIGLPKAYCRATGITDYRDALKQFGFGEWADFYESAEVQEEIGLRRPFYPRAARKKGETKQEHLLRALGLAKEDLYRQCELASEGRPAASPLFWTIGPKQVGKAAIHGWREVIQPVILADRVSLGIWPFDGDLFDLLEKNQVVVAETYPAEACVHLGLGAPGSGWSKTRQTDRSARSSELLRHAAKRRLQLSDELRQSVRSGFGSDKNGDDRFDAFVGLLLMLDVVDGHLEDCAPETPEVEELEGWILGRPASRA